MKNSKIQFSHEFYLVFFKLILLLILLFLTMKSQASAIVYIQQKIKFYGFEQHVYLTNVLGLVNIYFLFYIWSTHV